MVMVVVATTTMAAEHFPRRCGGRGVPTAPRCRCSAVASAKKKTIPPSV